MKITRVPTLVVPLVALVVGGCSPDPGPPDMNGPADLSAGIIDMHRPPQDMTGLPQDMTPPPGDMRVTPTDMPPPPADLAGPAVDMAGPAVDMAGPVVDMAVPAADMTMPPVDMAVPVVDMATPADLTMTPPDLSGADLTTPPPPPAPTEVIVMRVGDGAKALDATAAAAFLERYKISDGSMVGTPIALPTAVSGTNRRLTLGGFTSSEGSLNRSTDGHYVVFGGYDAAVGTANVSTSAAATVNRVLGRLDAMGTVDTSTASAFFNLGSLRSVISTDGTALWATGTVGVIYDTFGSTTAPTTLVAGNMRWIQIMFGQLYLSSASTLYHGVNAVGTGTPMAPPAPAILLSGFSAQPMSSHYGFFGLDRDATPGIDVIYVADDRDAAAGGGIQRWTLTGTTWKLDGTIKNGLTTGPRGVTGYISGTNVVLLATTAETTTRLVSYVDDGTALDMLPIKPLASAATNTAYRGVAFAPQ